MPNFVWPPPFLPPPIPIQPPPVVMQDVHFFPIPPHPGMAIIGAPMPFQMPIQTKVPAPTVVPVPPSPTLPQQPKPIETGYQTMTTTTFIPVGTLAEAYYQKPDKPVVKAEALVTNNFYSPLNTPEKPPAAETGKKTEKETLPAPQRDNGASKLIPVYPAAPSKKQQREEQYHYHTHRYPSPPLAYDKHERKEVSNSSTRKEECNLGHINTPEKQKEPEVMKSQANCGAHAELKVEKEKKKKPCSSESSHLISEAAKPNDYHHHHYYTQGGAYPFPFPIPTQQILTSQTEQHATLQTLAEMQDAIRNLQLAQAALTSRVGEVDHEVQPPPSESQIPSANVQPEPEVDTGFHITAAGYENAKAEKPSPTSAEATSPGQSKKPSSEPGTVPLDGVPCGPAKPTPPESQYLVSNSYGCPSFPHQHFGLPCDESHMQIPGSYVYGGLPPYQPGFNYSTTYQAAGVNPPGYSYSHHFQGCYPRTPINSNYQVSGRKKDDKHTYGEFSDSSSEGESYYTRVSRCASVGEIKSRRRCPEPKSSASRQDESSSKAPNLETRRPPKVTFSIPMSAQSNINSSDLNLLPTSSPVSSSSSSSPSSSFSSSPSSSSHSKDPQESISKKERKKMERVDRSEFESSTNIDTSHDKTAGAGSSMALAKETVTNVTTKFAPSIGASAVKLDAAQKSESETTEETREAVETTVSEQKGKFKIEPSAGKTVILGHSERARSLSSPAVGEPATASTSPWATLLSSIKKTAPSSPPSLLPGSCFAVDSGLRIYSTSISENKVHEPTPTCKPTAHLSSHERIYPSLAPPPPPSPPLPPPKKVTIVELGNNAYILGEGSNTEELEAGQSKMGGKGLATSPLVSITQNKHTHKCCCYEKRKEERGKRKVTEEGKVDKKRRKEKSEKSCKRKDISSDCHLCKVEGVHGAGALFKVCERKFEEKVENKGSMLRDMALGACAGGLGYFAGTMVNRKQTKIKEEKKSTNLFKCFGIGLGQITGEEVAQGSVQKPELRDNDGVYTLSEIPPTPAPPEGCILPVANTKPIYPGWNNEPLNLVMSEIVPSQSHQKRALAGATVPSTSVPLERRHRHRHHHYREYHEDKEYKERADTFMIDLPKETLLRRASGGQTKDGSVKFFLHMKNRKGEWVATENGRQGVTITPLVVTNNHASRAFMRGALHNFTVDCEAAFPQEKLAAASTIESKKSPYPPAVDVDVESDVSELSAPQFLHGQAHHYNDVSELGSQFLPTATPPSTFFHPQHVQHSSVQPQPSKVNIAPAYDPLECESPWQPEHHGHYMLPINPPPPPAPHDLRRVSFQHSPAQQQHQQQTLELAVDGSKSEWWGSGEEEEGGVELDNRMGMGIVDPPLRRRI